MRTNIVIDEKLMKETPASKPSARRSNWGCAQSFASANRNRSAGFAANFRGEVTWMR